MPDAPPTPPPVPVQPDYLFHIGNHGVNGVELFGALCLGIFMFVMIRAHFNAKSKIDLTDLLLDYQVPQDPRYKTWAPRITMRMFTGFCGFFIGAWTFLYSVIYDKLDKNWAGISAFMTVCFTVQLGAEVVRGFTSKMTQDAPAPPAPAPAPAPQPAAPPPVGPT